MSIQCMTRVWAESKHKGSQLLLLLAIADNASDDGFAWPSVQTLAKKTRMSDRHTVRMLEDLEKSGELILSKAEGKRHQYIVTVGLTTEQINKTANSRMLKMSPLTSCHPRQVVTPDKLSPLTSCHKTPDKLSYEPLTSCHKTPDKLSSTTSQNLQKIKDLEGKKTAEPSCNHHEEEPLYKQEKELTEIFSPSLENQTSISVSSDFDFNPFAENEAELEKPKRFQVPKQTTKPKPAEETKSVTKKETQPKSKMPLSFFPAPFLVTKEMQEWAKTNCPLVNWQGETEKLKDWALSNAIKKADWVATWRNWLRKTQSDLETKNPGAIRAQQVQNEIKVEKPPIDPRWKKPYANSVDEVERRRKLVEAGLEITALK